MSYRLRGPSNGGVGQAWLLCLYLAVALATSSTSTLSLEKPTAAFLETHLEDQISLQDYWHAAVSFRKIGYTAHLLSPFTGVMRIYPENLTGFVSVLLITPRDAVSLGVDIDMLAKYVAEGNGMIVAGQASSTEYEPWARSTVNELTSKFGIEFQRDMVCDPTAPFLGDERYPHWPMVSDFEEHPVSEGIDLISYHSGCSLKIWGNATAIARTSERSWSDMDFDEEYDEDRESGGVRTIAAVSEYGKGRVACIGDNNLWSSRYLDGFDNNELLLNMVKWVSRDLEEPELRIAALDASPEVVSLEDGNLSADVSVRIWNQGNLMAKNLTIYVSQGNAEIPEGNLTYESVEAGEVIDAEIEVRFEPENCRHIRLSYEYFTEDSKESKALRTIKLEYNNTLYNIRSIFGNKTLLARGSTGGWGNYTDEELDLWANASREMASETGLVWDVLNHTEVASKVGNTYSIKTAEARKDIIGFGDPESNFLVAFASQEGGLRVYDNLTPPSLVSGSLIGTIETEEEAYSRLLELDGNLSEWGYMIMACEETFIDQADNRLGVGGFGRAGLETAIEVFRRTWRGEISQYGEELAGTYALFRGVYDGEGELVDLEFR